MFQLRDCFISTRNKYGVIQLLWVGQPRVGQQDKGLTQSDMTVPDCGIKVKINVRFTTSKISSNY